jgi:hypothetical protein
MIGHHSRDGRQVRGDTVIKWRLMLTTLPYVAGVLLLKLWLQFGIGFAGLVDFSDVGMVFTAGVFLLGFLLAGTMADFKEAEKIPAELASTLETLEDVFVLSVVNRPGLDLASLRRSLLEMTDAIRSWLVGKQSTPEVYAAMSAFGGQIELLERNGAGPYASRAVPQVLAVRRSVSRIDVITRTGFLPPAYALLEVLIVMIISLALVARFKSTTAECLLVPFIALINIYMLRLIRDIDNPFDYEVDGRQHGSGEVPLYPLDEYRARLAARTGPAATGASSGHR